MVADTVRGGTVNYRVIPFTVHYSQKYCLSLNQLAIYYEWGRRTLTLPLYSSVSEERQDRVVRAVTTDVYSLRD